MKNDEKPVFFPEKHDCFERLSRLIHHFKMYIPHIRLLHLFSTYQRQIPESTIKKKNVFTVYSFTFPLFFIISVKINFFHDNTPKNRFFPKKY